MSMTNTHMYIHKKVKGQKLTGLGHWTWGSFGRQHVMIGKRWMWGIKPTNKQKRILKRKEEGHNYIIKYIQTLRKFCHLNMFSEFGWPALSTTNTWNYQINLEIKFTLGKKTFRFQNCRLVYHDVHLKFFWTPGEPGPSQHARKMIKV